MGIGAIAHLGLARAYAFQRDTAKAQAAYQDFLALWKDADPDIPILIAAKAEYAKLKHWLAKGKLGTSRGTDWEQTTPEQGRTPANSVHVSH